VANINENLVSVPHFFSFLPKIIKSNFFRKVCNYIGCYLADRVQTYWIGFKNKWFSIL